MEEEAYLEELLINRLVMSLGLLKSSELLFAFFILWLATVFASVLVFAETFEISLRSMLFGRMMCLSGE